MSSRLFGLLDLMLVFLVVLAFGFWQFWSSRRWREKRRLDAEKGDKAQ